ncbi:group 1 truncated hemoglobin [Pseudomonas sp.]|uniref:group I truncated hemoglobin n=1 Tax=Pseudomonas sp. TaxID=306 RepID=UPI00262B6EF5|nr:group 1 truncated hemoglobin [Pseudomonas sp.]
MRPLLWTLIVVLAGCAQTPAHNDDLYVALGQRAGLQRIVEGMLLNIARDKRISGHFKSSHVVRSRDKLVEQFCVETGGPCRYTGDSMAESHKGQHLTHSDFNALVEDLIDAMDAQKIPVPTQNRLIAKLAPMRGDVIDK